MTDRFRKDRPQYNPSVTIPLPITTSDTMKIAGYAALVNSLKGVSSRMLRKDRPDLGKRYYQGVLWSPTYYAASCSGASLAKITQYIDQQRTPG